MIIPLRFVCGAVCAVLFLLPSGLFAYSVQNVDVVEANDFVIEPAKIELFGDPGDVVKKTITIIDRVPGQSRFSISLEDFIGSDDPTVAVKLLGNEISRYTFRNNIEPEIQDITLSFGQKVVIPITIRIPANASPGGYYTSVVVTHASEGGALEGSGAQTVSRVAQLLFVRVSGDVKETGITKEFVVTPTTPLHIHGPLGFNILFENRGNVHLAPYGYVHIRNLVGGTVAQIPIDAYYSLPQSSRYREVVWTPGFLFGYYTATLELNRGYRSEDVVDTLSTSFIYIPRTYIIVFVGILLFLFLLRRFFMQRFEIKRRR